MIEYVLATEFDNKLGTCIVGCHPTRLQTESDHLLADYLIPDGMHRTDRDNYVFRSVLALGIQTVEQQVNSYNSKGVKANLYVYSSSQRTLYDKADVIPGTSFAFRLSIIELKFLSLKYSRDGQTKQKAFVLHSETEVRQMTDKLYTLKSEDGAVYLIEFESKSEGFSMNGLVTMISDNMRLKQYLKVDRPDVVLKSGWFFCFCFNKKDESAERGTIYRSLALFSSNINIFEPFRPSVMRCMESYQNLPPRPKWGQYQQENLDQLIANLYQECNSMVSPDEEGSLRMENTSLINPTLSKEMMIKHGLGIKRIQVYPRLFGTSSRVLLDTLGPSTMILYRAILSEANIAFFGDKLKVETICSLVTATLHLVCPLNIVSKIFPFEHVQSLEILKNTRGFIAGFTNPIVRNPKLLNWHFMVDINKGTVVDASMRSPFVHNENDRVFVEAVIKRVKEDGLDVHEVDRLFFEYTKANIDVMLNKSNVIRFDKEDEQTMQMLFELSNNFKQTKFFEYLDINIKNEREEFQTLYQKKYLGVYQAYKFFTESEKFEDVDLVVALENLRLNLLDTDLIDFFLKKVLERLGSLDCMTIGLLSEDENVRKTNHKVLAQLELSAMWREHSTAAPLFKSVLISTSMPADRGHNS